MASIADLFGKLLLDDSGFEASVVKSAGSAADAATKTMGQRVSSGLKAALGTGLKAAGTGAALAMGVATKGVVDLENATARFRAETGATATEAEAMGKTINRVAGEQQTSLDAVTDAAIRVRRDLGAVGPEADDLTSKFVKFARVTKQDAAGAVSAYDDILDSWGLTAKDAGQIMDKLLVSQHKFGGELTETQATLAALAPAMRAANLTIDDGISLLGLFGAKGLDAGQASAAFAKALTKVKSPAELQALITDISNTTDPFQRAAKAADLFGAKAGAKLANALGGAKISDYTISIEEAAGATDKAADIIDSTVSGRISKAFSVASAQLREFGASFGPGVTGIASLVTAAATLGGGKLAKAVLGPLGGLGKQLAVKLAEAVGVSFGSSVVAGAASAGGEAIGDLSAKQIEKRLAGTAAASAVSNALTGAAESSAVTGAATTLGTKIGITIGNAIKLGALVGIAAIAQEISGPTQDLGIQVHEAIFGKGGDPLKDAGKWLLDLPWPLGPKGQPDWARLGAETDKGLDTAVIQPMTGTAEHAGKLADDIAGNFGVNIGEAMNTMADRVVLAGAKTGKAIDKTAADIEAKRGAIISAIDAVGDHSSTAANDYATAALKIQASSKKTKEKLASDANDLIDKAFDPQIRYYDLVAAESELSAARQAAAAKGASNAEKEAVVQAEKALAEQLVTMAQAGETNSNAYKKGIAELKADIKNATGPTKTYLQGVLEKLHSIDSVDPKVDITVDAKYTAAARAAIKQFGVAGGTIQDFSTSVRRRAAGGPVQPGVPYIVGERRPELFVPSTNGQIIPRVPSMAAGWGGSPINVTMNLTASDTTLTTAKRFANTILDTVADGLREQTARVTA